MVPGTICYQIVLYDSKSLRRKKRPLIGLGQCAWALNRYRSETLKSPVVCALRLKIEKPRTYLILTIKEFYKNNYPEEYELHERFADWDTRCFLDRYKLARWCKKATKDGWCEERRKEITNYEKIHQ